MRTSRMHPEVRQGTKLERDGTIGVVTETNEYGHALLTFMPKWSGVNRPQEWVRVADWRIVDDAIQTGRNQIQE